jgi:hypothetical protein
MGRDRQSKTAQQTVKILIQRLPFFLNFHIPWCEGRDTAGRPGHTRPVSIGPWERYAKAAEPEKGSTVLHKPPLLESVAYPHKGACGHTGRGDVRGPKGLDRNPENRGWESTV